MTKAGMGERQEQVCEGDDKYCQCDACEAVRKSRMDGAMHDRHKLGCSGWRTRVYGRLIFNDFNFKHCDCPAGNFPDA